LILKIIENSDVFSVGCNNSGQLGLGNKINYETIQKIEFFNNKNIIDINSGWYHSLAINKKFEVYSWGKNEEGQLGNGNYTTQLTPIKIYQF